MRLIDVTTKQVAEFLGKPPPYAILSHTWGDDEVTLQELADPAARQKQGFAKISQFCATVSLRLPNIKYVWVDTCCIDKSSSAELTEAINSMFRWYREAVRCFAYLQDVSLQGKCEAGPEFESCRWFSRGWTLQELLAPRDLEFFDRDWKLIGEKQSLCSRISKATGIQESALKTDAFHEYSAACRMSWASQRQTTRTEDMAYCLLGIFDINMPMLYGEGEKAFLRLQEEILKSFDDQSLLAWDAESVPASEQVSTLAKQPSCFRGGAELMCRPSSSEPLVITNKGIRLRLPVLSEPTSDFTIGLLSCSTYGDVASLVGIRLERSRDGSEVYHRARAPLYLNSMMPIHIHGMFSSATTLTLAPKTALGNPKRNVSECWLDCSRQGCTVLVAYPKAQWVHNGKTGTSTWTLPSTSEDVFESILAVTRKKTGKRYAIRVKLQPTDGLGKVLVQQLEEDIDVQILALLNDAVQKSVTSDSMPGQSKACDVVARLVPTLLRGRWSTSLELQCM
ncbi:hypothetical protein PWT90_02311 [Aphanocladium album]|nr:hypothetical protein PWT90_02311 [Aphanocladium album]